ncbi:MAG TPA: 2-hydroxyacyl-CoA dehydratase, partial [Dehalococcoidia bacterium]|nr:2-hydroxyacyl-CoA dehydratase [Dehalococcoidia bacterium]
MTNNYLKQVDKYYNDYGYRARELHEQGRKVIGYLCAFTPVEIITAAGFIPFRIKGDVNEPITRADTQMETIICPVVRSAYDVTLKGRYDFLDGLVIPHACDSISRTYDIWKYSLDVPYSHLVNLPHSIDDSSLGFYKHELNTFRKSIGNYAGKAVTEEDLAQAVELHNRI